MAHQRGSVAASVTGVGPRRNSERSGSTPEQYSADLERQRLVQEAMASLSAEQRQAIALAYYWGLSQSEIADRLQLPLGTVKTRMRLGMIRLREVLAPHGEGVRS
ncbi:MAG: sigma-70 family RNA polymerase sigma factor [Nitrospira sp.]|nr:MAG: sigma-70 family RNA polymerase sigma factor [Nitrospira sp.]